MRPRILPGGANPGPEWSARFRANPVFRGGAENGTRGGCAPQPVGEFGLRGVGCRAAAGAGQGATDTHEFGDAAEAVGYGPG